MEEREIVIIHMVTGATIVARIIEHHEFEVQVSKPMEIVLRRGAAENQIIVGFSPYLTLGGVLPEFEVLAIPGHAILVPLRECPEAIARNYVTATTGIQITGQIPPAKSPLIR